MEKTLPTLSIFGKVWDNGLLERLQTTAAM
jgi:hypothetical protein